MRYQEATQRNGKAGCLRLLSAGIAFIAVLALGGCPPKIDIPIGDIPVIGSAVDGNLMRAYQELLEQHRKATELLGAKTLREDIGEECFSAAKEFFRSSWIDGVLVLRDSPLMNAQDERWHAVMLEDVIHVRSGAPLYVAHELAHAEQQRTLGVGFWPLYLGAHVIDGYAGNFLELQARNSQRAFDMQHPMVCEGT